MVPCVNFERHTYKNIFIPCPMKQEQQDMALSCQQRVLSSALSTLEQNSKKVNSFLSQNQSSSNIMHKKYLLLSVIRSSVQEQDYAGRLGI